MKYNAKGSKIERDMGWCDFRATDKYRDNYDSIFSKRCLRCRKKIEDSNDSHCKQCYNETTKG